MAIIYYTNDAHRDQAGMKENNRKIRSNSEKVAMVQWCNGNNNEGSPVASDLISTWESYRLTAQKGD